MKPSWRKPAGILGLLLYITLWSVLVVSQSGWISALPWPLETLAYVISGIIWIVPLRPVLIWMETGSFRAPPP